MRPSRFLMAVLLYFAPLCAAEARNGYPPHIGFGVNNIDGAEDGRPPRALRRSSDAHDLPAFTFWAGQAWKVRP